MYVVNLMAVMPYHKTYYINTRIPSIARKDFIGNVNKGPTRCNSMQTFIHCHVTLHVSGVTHPSSGVLKTVCATSGVCRGNGTVTSFHLGLIRTGVSESCGMCLKFHWYSTKPEKV